MVNCMFAIAKHAVRKTVCKFANHRYSSKVTSFLDRKERKEPFFYREYPYISAHLFKQARVHSKEGILRFSFQPFCGNDAQVYFPDFLKINALLANISYTKSFMYLKCRYRQGFQ